MRRAKAAAAVLSLAAASFALPAAAQSPVDRFAACAACHGADGVSTMPDTPSLAGQHAFYAVTQLFLFREGRRANPAMTAMAKGMSDDDLRAFSERIAKLPATASAQADPPDAARMARGSAIAAANRCASCHGPGFEGDKQVPRIAGQREDYLARTLAEFKAGTRIGYTSAMNETLAGVAAADLPDVAYFLARQPGTAKP